MERRDLIKSIIVLPAAVKLAGCSQSDVDIADGDEVKIEPKQTSVYEFSAILPFDFKVIDELCDLNQKYKKSKIVTLYNNINYPRTSSFNSWVNPKRSRNKNSVSPDDFFKFVNYAQDRGFEVCYTMNSPKPFNKNDYMKFKNEFLNLVERLEKNNVKTVKVANIQVLELLKELKTDFIISASTAFKFQSMAQHINLFNNYPNIKFIDLSSEFTNNFHFLKSFKSLFPDVKVELMVNSLCFKGCPYEFFHLCSGYLAKQCGFDSQNHEFQLLRSGHIYPHDLSYYSSIGINNFKFVSMSSEAEKIANIIRYLDCVEYGTDAYLVSDFLKDFFATEININRNIKLTSMLDCLPDMKHFMKNGDKCAYKCGVDCFYCDKKAKQLRKYIDKIKEI